MGAIGPTGLIFRDFIKYILPTLIAVLLFGPLFSNPGNKFPIDVAVFGSFVLGYVVYTPIARLSDQFVEYTFQRFSTEYQKYKDQKDWWSGNWDYDALWILLDKEEREYLYLTQSYLEFYLISGFYMTIYAAWNICLVIINTVNEWEPATSTSNLFSQLIKSETQMFWGGSFYTLIVLVVASIIAYYLFRNFIDEFDVLYADDGFYPNFAKRYNEKDGSLAVGIWGLVLNDISKGNPLPNVKIDIFANSELLESCTTNARGYFKLQANYIDNFGKTLNAKISDVKWEGENSLEVMDKKTPQFLIKATAKV